MAVTEVHPDYEASLRRWQLCRDVIGGEDRVKESDQARKYLPPKPGHRKVPDLYETYAEEASFYGATGRTHSGLRGLIERRDPDIEYPEESADLKAFVEDCTGDGVSLEEMGIYVADEILQTGRCGLLTDYAPGSTAGMTRKRVEELGRRPYFTLYPAESITNWFVVDGTLVCLVLREQEEVRGEDRFEREFRPVYRVLELEETEEVEGDEVTYSYGQYRQRTFKKRPKDSAAKGGEKDEWVEVGEPVVPLMNSKPLDEIPFDFANARSTTPGVDKPPLLDLAKVNLAHYRNSASYESGLGLAGSPTPWVTGYDPAKEEIREDGETGSDDEPFLMGGGFVWTIKNPAAKVGKISINAEDLGAIEKAMDRKETQMVILGARVIESEERPAESGVAKAIDDDRDSSQLATISKMGSKALTRAFRRARDWYGVKGDVGVSLNTDFFGRPLTPAEAQMIVDLWQTYRIYAKSDARRMLRRGEWIPAERTDEMIDDELESEDIPPVPETPPPPPASPAPDQPPDQPPTT